MPGRMMHPGGHEDLDDTVVRVSCPHGFYLRVSLRGLCQEHSPEPAIEPVQPKLSRFANWLELRWLRRSMSDS